MKYVAHSALSYSVHYCSWETLSKSGDFFTTLFFFGETFAWTCFYCQSLDTTVNDPLMTYVPQLQACYAMIQFLISENPDRGKPIEIDITPLPNTHITKSLKAGKRVLGALTKEWLTIILAISQQVFEHVGQGVARKRLWDLLAKKTSWQSQPVVQEVEDTFGRDIKYTCHRSTFCVLPHEWHVKRQQEMGSVDVFDVKIKGCSCNWQERQLRTPQ